MNNELRGKMQRVTNNYWRITIAFCISLFTSPSMANAGRYDYFEDNDIFAYLENEEGGLSLFPDGDRIESERAAKESKKLRGEMKSGFISKEELKTDIAELLKSKNYVGFLHYCGVIGHAKRNTEAFSAFEQLLGDDAELNMVIVYGALVVSEFSDGHNKQVIRHFMQYVEKGNYAVKVTNRFPEILHELEVQLKW